MSCCVCVAPRARHSRGGGTCVLQPSRPLLTNYRHSRHTQRCCERGRAQHSQPGEANLSRRVDAELALLYLLTNKCNHSPAQLQTTAVPGATHTQCRRLFIDGSPCACTTTSCGLPPPCCCCCGHPGTPHSHDLITLMLAGLLTVAAQPAASCCMQQPAHTCTLQQTTSD